jgi:hypothetical protein
MGRSRNLLRMIWHPPTSPPQERSPASLLAAALLLGCGLLAAGCKSGERALGAALPSADPDAGSSASADGGPGQSSAGRCSDDAACPGGGICSDGSCRPSACNQRHAGVTGIRARVHIDRYQGLIHGENGDHEIAWGTLSQVLWIYAGALQDTTSVQLAMNVASSTDPAGLPRELPLAPGSTVEVEGEYIPAATADAHGSAVIHFTHSTCGYVKIGNSVY